MVVLGGVRYGSSSGSGRIFDNQLKTCFAEVMGVPYCSSPIISVHVSIGAMASGWVLLYCLPVEPLLARASTDFQGVQRHTRYRQNRCLFSLPPSLPPLFVSLSFSVSVFSVCLPFLSLSPVHLQRPPPTSPPAPRHSPPASPPNPHRRPEDGASTPPPRPTGRHATAFPPAGPRTRTAPPVVLPPPPPQPATLRSFLVSQVFFLSRRCSVPELR